MKPAIKAVSISHSLAPSSQGQEHSIFASYGISLYKVAKKHAELETAQPLQTGLGSWKAPVAAFLLSDQCITVTYLGELCLKPYLIYVVDYINFELTALNLED